jgi:hypothetical protein
MWKHAKTDLTTGEMTIEDVPEHLAKLPPNEMIEAIIHDCPECRAERARGEQPLLMQPARRDVIRDRRPRWRKLKRRAGR